ncbi:CHAT domain-containing protein [Nocardia sp. NPDC059240]|uniref:CHAT domain-containing protein n=1 Tax=Nocardia sp. NPDC059240 TaxID=3346786 RepID=UPI0036BECCE4
MDPDIPSATPPSGEGVRERNRALALVKARLKRVAETQAADAVTESGAVEDANQLWELKIDPPGGVDVAALHVLGWFHWYRYVGSEDQTTTAQDDKIKAVKRFTLCLFFGPSMPLPKPLLPLLADCAADVATLAAQPQSVDHSSWTDLKAQAWGRIVAATADDHPSRAKHLNQLGQALHARFRSSHSSADLDEAITTCRRAVEAIRTGQLVRAPYLHSLGEALLSRFQLAGSIADLNEAIAVCQQELPSGVNSETGEHFHTLSEALLARFSSTQTRADLDDAIIACSSAVEATAVGQFTRALYLHRFGQALLTRFRSTQSIADLDQAITLTRQSVAEAWIEDPYRSQYLFTVSAALSTRFTHAGSIADLNIAIDANVQAFEATPKNYSGRAARLADHSVLLRSRYSRLGKTADLTAAIMVARQAVATMTADSKDRVKCLCTFGTAVYFLFQRNGSTSDLAKSIGLFRQALAATSDSYPEREVPLTQLAHAMQARFNQTGSVPDLDEAIELYRHAIAAAHDSHPHEGVLLAHLASALRNRFVRIQSDVDLDEAISVAREAVADTRTDSPCRNVVLTSLGTALWTRFRRDGSSDDLDEAIIVAREAVAVTTTNHPGRAHYLNNLVTPLTARFNHGGAVADLDEAIEAGREAVAGTPDRHPDLLRYLSNLGDTLASRLERFGSTADLDEAVAVYTRAFNTDTAAPSARIMTAEHAAKLLGADKGWVASILAEAVRLLPETASRELTRPDQQYALRRFAGLASSAVAATLAAHENQGAIPDDVAISALQLLEQGRAVLLSQTLETRTDLTDLSSRHPRLAKRFTDLRDRLDEPWTTQAPHSLTAPDATGGAPIEFELGDRHSLASEFNSLLSKIRLLKGFNSFLQPPSIDEMKAQASQGPIVIVNVSETRSDALILRLDGVKSLPLPRLELTLLKDKIEIFYRFLAITISHSATSPERKAAQTELHEVLEWLWDTTAEPVLSELGFVTTPATDNLWPRMWWSPGGLLGLLPIHAAGYHRTDQLGFGEHRTVLDRAICSYTPTVRALRHARERTTSDTTVSALVVAMPRTPGANDLDQVTTEAAKVAAQLPGARVYDDGLTTTTTILAKLPKYAIVHFACHGTSDPADPSHNRLLFHDHEVNPFTVARMAPIRLDRARLAYLSACETAFTGTRILLDESIHLASAFQMAGFPHVIGTFWPISDNLSVDIAEDFYHRLRNKDGSLELDKAAYALHHTIRAVRDKLPALPSIWAPYMHSGSESALGASVSSTNNPAHLASPLYLRYPQTGYDIYPPTVLDLLTNHIDHNKSTTTSRRNCI